MKLSDLSCLALVLLPGVLHADIIAISSSAATTVGAALQPDFPTYVENTNSQSQGSTLNPLSSVNTLTRSNSIGTVTTQGANQISWTNSSSGLVTFTNLGFQTSPTVPQLNADVGISDGVRYTFVGPDAPATLTISYATSLTGTNTLGIEGFNVRPYQLNQTLGILYQDFGLVGQTTQSGLYEYQFSTLASDPLAGTVGWGFEIVANGRAIGGIGDLNSSLNGTFGFTITTVPEPSSLALMFMAAYGVWFKKRTRQT